MDPCLRNRRQATIGPTCRTNDLFVLFSGDANGWAAVQDDGAVCEKIQVACGPSPAQSSGTMWIASEFSITFFFGEVV